MVETNHRDDKKAFIKSLLILKCEHIKVVDDFTALISEKTKEINLTTREMTKLILEARKEIKSDR